MSQEQNAIPQHQNSRFQHENLSLSTQKKKNNTKTLYLSFRNWDCSSRTPGQRSECKSGTSERKIIVTKHEMSAPGLNIVSNGTEGLGRTGQDLSTIAHDLSNGPQGISGRTQDQKT